MILTETKNNHTKHQGIVISDLSFNWPDGTHVFSKINAQFGNNKTALIGQNGAGKSTLLRLIVGELIHNMGSIQ